MKAVSDEGVSRSEFGQGMNDSDGKATSRKKDVVRGDVVDQLRQKTRMVRWQKDICFFVL